MGKYVHGHAGRKRNNPTYRVWRALRARCSDPRYVYYCGRGIKCCERWGSFELFLQDMGYRPSSDHSIERVNVNGDYDPENCVWATAKQQCRNKRNNRVLVLGGISKSAVEWSEELGIPASRIVARKLLGWSDEKALSLPKNQKLITFNGVTRPMRHWAKALDLNYRTIWLRLKKGWSVEKALSTRI